MRRSLSFYIPLLVFAVVLYALLFLGVSSIQQFVRESSMSSILSLTGTTLPAEEQKIFAVTRIIDGDTIEVQTALTKEKVRLLGINTPEMRQEHPDCFAKEATARIEELLSDKSVRLEADITQDDKDRYGRLLRYVYTDEDFVNLRLVEGGFAKEYTYQKPYIFQTLFKDAQREAERFQRGLWYSCT